MICPVGMLSESIMHCVIYTIYQLLHYAAKSTLFIHSNLPLSLLICCILECITVEYYLSYMRQLSIKFGEIHFQIVTFLRQFFTSEHWVTVLVTSKHVYDYFVSCLWNSINYDRTNVNENADEVAQQSFLNQAQSCWCTKFLL